MPLAKDTDSLSNGKEGKLGMESVWPGMPFVERPVFHGIDGFNSL